MTYNTKKLSATISQFLTPIATWSSVNQQLRNPVAFYNNANKTLNRGNSTMKSSSKKIILRHPLAFLKAAFSASIFLGSMATASGSDIDILETNPMPTIACMGHTAEYIATQEARYHYSIIKYSDQYGVSPNFVKAVVSVESCFNHKAVSSAGAIGLMQLMPKTAEWLGVTDAFDSEQNLEAGIRYLSQLKKRFNNNNKLTLAAYNAGPGNVRKYKGIPPFPETQKYVVKVQKRYHEYQAWNQLAFVSAQ